MIPDEAYDNLGAVEGSDEFPDRWARDAQAFRDSLGARAQTGVKYGPSPRQTFDFFMPTGVSRGTMVFVHGGYWRRFDAGYFSHLASGAVAKGWAVAMPSYDLCPDVSIAEISVQTAAALTKIADRTQGPIALCGHSAGGHLVARVMDPLLLSSEVRSRIGQIVSISPVSDLTPLMQITMNEILQIDEGIAQSESPINMSPPHGIDVTVWVGGDELPAFLAQAEGLSRAWGAKQVVVDGKHHFDVIDALADPDSDMLAALLGLK